MVALDADRIAFCVVGGMDEQHSLNACTEAERRRLSVKRAFHFRWRQLHRGGLFNVPGFASLNTSQFRELLAR